MYTTALLSTFVAFTSARIIGFAAPTTIAPDTTIEVKILTENYVQSVSDVAISFGLSPAESFYPGTLGSLLSSKFLGPDLSNTLENITHYVHIPATTANGSVVLSAAHFALFGKSVSPSLENYAVNVTVGESTSSTYVNSVRIEAA